MSTLEETEFPQFYYRGGHSPEDAASDSTGQKTTSSQPDRAPEVGAESASGGQPELSQVQPTVGSVEIKENQTGISYEKVFGPYLKGAQRVDMVDPYIRMFHQARNLMEFIEVIINGKPPEDEVVVRLTTIQDDERGDQQTELLKSIQANAARAGVDFDWTYDEGRTIHDRRITTDTGWKIALGRGLDIYQAFDFRDAFNLGHRNQEYRRCKECQITFLQSD